VQDGAGGVTSVAHPDGSLFTRECLKEREREQIRMLTDRIWQDPSSLALQSVQLAGRSTTQPDAISDLRDRDHLRSPKMPQEVTVFGEVRIATSHGSVDAGSGWFRSSNGMRPGNTIVVPLDAERMRPLPLWTAVLTILDSIAISVAAVSSF
jgi:polysaccharide biosynthesis/export protein